MLSNLLFTTVFLSFFALFLAQGTSTVQRSNDPVFTLNLAAKNGDFNGVYSAIANGADINAVDTFSKRSAVLNAALSGHTFILDYLLKQPKVDPYVVDKEGMTMWQHCCTIGRVPIAEVLAKYQINPQRGNARPQDEIPPLHRCVYSENINNLAVMDNMKKVKSFNVNHANPKGITALMVAAKQGNVRNTKWLLKNGAKADATDNSKRTALVYCIIGLEAREQAWRDEQAVKGDSPPDSIREPFLTIFQLLVENGADPEAQDIFRESPAQMVSFKKDNGLGRIISDYKFGALGKTEL